MIDNDEKLIRTLSRYKAYVNRLKQSRPKTILLEPISIIPENEMYSKLPCNNKLQPNSCISKKKNGLPCPSVLKKGSLYCHRHSKLHNQTKCS